MSLKIGSPLRAAITPTVRGPRDRRVRTGARAPVLPTLPALAAESRAAADGHGVLAAHSGVPGRAEPRPPSVTAALAGPPIRRLRLEAVRPTDRAASPAEAAATRHVAPCDAETGADLDGIAAAAAAVPDVIAVGSPRRAAVFGRPRDTARRAPARLGVTRLDLLHQVHPGAVRTRTGAHHEIVTRPGSHGGPDSLLPIARQPRHTDHQEDP
ncbi:hypothetical protein FHR81_005336 [Actinoalloteichus hoggarensis]|uniref:hypothetical protein n=1 Tax=Actinoalloteichus hoggarensis TaxID=1470176 RepID=UPI0016201A4E|nr:hypothetical protein [Actinoalloteichus hoggarensis]MBB5924259.1 hypothetical protein [Actinoalloteichus hoggarensis]